MYVHSAVFKAFASCLIYDKRVASTHAHHYPLPKELRARDFSVNFERMCADKKRSGEFISRGYTSRAIRLSKRQLSLRFLGLDSATNCSPFLFGKFNDAGYHISSRTNTHAKIAPLLLLHFNNTVPPRHGYSTSLSYIYKPQTIHEETAKFLEEKKRKERTEEEEEEEEVVKLRELSVGVITT